MKAPFKFLITYFKPSGKFYTEAVVEWMVSAVDEHPNLAYMYDAVAKLRGLRDHGGQNALPGLAGEGWDGPILIQQARKRPGIQIGVQVDSPDFYFGDGVPHILPQDKDPDEIPMQPVIIDAVGEARFKANSIIKTLIKMGIINLDGLSLIQFPDEAWSQFMQLTGCTLAEFANLAYVDEETARKADMLGDRALKRKVRKP